MKIKVNEKLLGGGLCTCMFPFMVAKNEDSEIKNESEVKLENEKTQEKSKEEKV